MTWLWPELYTEEGERLYQDQEQKKKMVGEALADTQTILGAIQNVDGRIEVE